MKTFISLESEILQKTNKTICIMKKKCNKHTEILKYSIFTLHTTSKIITKIRKILLILFSDMSYGINCEIKCKTAIMYWQNTFDSLPHAFDLVYKCMILYIAELTNGVKS